MARQCCATCKGFPIEVTFWALFFSLVGMWMATFMLVARLGLHTPRTAVATALVFAVSVAFSPHLAPKNWLLDRIPTARALMAPVLLALLQPFLVHLLGPATRYLLLATAMLGVMRAVPFMRRFSARRCLVLLVVPLCCAFYIFSYLHRAPIWFVHAYLPEHALLGIQIIDSYYHAAIVSMIQNFAVASTGLDGLARHSYHVGAHYWFAAFGLTLGAEALITIMIGHMVVVLPVMLMAFVYSLLFIAARSGASLVLAGAGASLFLAFLNAFAWKIYIYVSESAALSFALLSLALMLLVESFGVRARQHVSAGTLRLLAWVAIIVFALTAVKATTGLVWCGFFVYGWVRREGFTAIGLAGIITATGALLLAVWLLLLPETANLRIGTASTLLLPAFDWHELNTGAAMLALPFALACTVTCRRVFGSRRVLLASVVHSPSDADALVAELVVIGYPVSLILAGAVYMGMYYGLAVFWVAGPLLIVQCALMLERLPSATSLSARVLQWPLPRIIGLVLGAGTACLLITALVREPGSRLRLELPGQRVGAQMLVALDDSVHGNLLAGRSAQEYIAASFSQRGVLFGPDFATEFARTVGAEAVSAIAREANMAKSGLAVFADASDASFWRLTEGQCMAMSLFVPALVGLPMLEGLPPERSGCVLQWYGFESYPADARSHTTNDADLCARALRKKFANVLILSEQDKTQRVRRLQCIAH